jgi:DNA-binding NtrC family response regulator
MKALKPSAVMAPAGPLVYVVDEAEGQAELYTLFLKGTGCVVQAYKHRVDALAALMADKTRPALLIIDYLGDSMPVDRFLQRCLVVHPSLRILMASELTQRDVMSFCVRPHRFIQKPFTADEFVQEVKAALEYSNVAEEPPCAYDVFNVIYVWVNQSVPR